MNVHGWRAEPEQVQSEHTLRLLQWMAATSVPASSIDAAATQVAGGLFELLDAQMVAVWARRTESDDLSLLATVGEGAGALAPEAAAAQEPPQVGAASGVLPRAPLWLDDASGEASEFASRLASYTSSDPEQQPSLVLALRSLGSEGEPLLLGVALLWLDSADGLLSEGLQPLVEGVASQGGQYLAAAARAERQARSFHQLAEAFAGAVDRKDPRRVGHTNAVAYYSALIARALDLNEEKVEQIEFAALLHDLGRISVPDSILQKSDALTTEELDLVRSAPTRGAELLQFVDGLDEVAAIVRHQTEKWNGTGAPDGLSGEAIPLGSRIIALATRFAAMTSARADRRPLSVVGGAMEAVVEDSGVTLDPKIVEAFLRAMGRSL